MALAGIDIRLLRKETAGVLDQKLTIALAITGGRRDKAGKILGIGTDAVYSMIKRRRKLG